MKIDIKNLIRDCVQEKYIFLENLILKRHDGKLVVVSDATDRKSQSAETFRNKNKLKDAGFRWDSQINSWTIDQGQLRKAQEVLQAISKSPIEHFIEKIEEIPEFLQNTDNLSKKDELTQKLDGYIEELSTAVDAAANSEAIKNFLAFNAKFHGYSFYNTMLIYIQNPKATKVAGFKQWEEKFHRRVKKGAKSISILAPIIHKDKDKPDAATTPAVPYTPTPTGQQPSDLNDKDKKKSFMHFMAVSVFDISDTEAIDARGEIPSGPEWHGDNSPNEKANELFKCAVEMSDDLGIKITQDKATRGEQGYSAGGHINITSEVEGVNKAATIIHEIAHELLHHKKSSPFYIGDDDISKDKRDNDLWELQAESVSFVVIKYFGLPADHQATYLALWRANKDAIKNNLTIIKKTADFIINELEKIHKEREKKVAPPAPSQVEQPIEDQDSVPIVPMNESIGDSPVHIFTVKNDFGGLNQIDSLRKLIKPNGFRLVLRGRGFRYGMGKPTKANGGNNQYQSSLPLDKAEKIAVYLMKTSSEETELPQSES